ncbi:MAG: hypothetical protein QOG87_755 [Actinomycetota bacterium]|jgi:hypothetical protein
MQYLARDELEHIDVEPVAPPAAPRRRRLSRAWIAALVVLAVVLGAVVALPARTELAKAGFRHADRIFVIGHSLSLQQQRLLGVLLSRSGTTDTTPMRRAEDRLREELRDRHAELRRSLRRDWRLRLDSQTDRFRAAVQRTLEPPVGDPAIASEAEYRARSLRERWHLAKPTPDADGLHSIDADVAALRRYVDRATGVRLVIGGPDGFTTLDLDRSNLREHRGPGLGTDAPVTRMVAGDGWLAGSDRGLQGWTIAERLDEPLAALGTGVPFPSDRRDTLHMWATNLHSVREVDATTGDVVAGPYFLPVDGTLESYRVAGVATSGIVIVRQADPRTTEVWDPEQRRVVRTLPGPAVAVAGDLVAWVENGPALMTHVTDLSDGTDAAAVPLWGHVGAFSPDRRLLALGSERGLVVVDVASRRVEHVPVTRLENTPTWDPSGRFLFFQAGGIGGWDAERHEQFHLRLPDLPAGGVLLAALAA